MLLLLKFPSSVKAENLPPLELQKLIQEAADSFNTPYCVLETVAWIEGGHMWGYNDDQILNFSSPGEIDLYNCQLGSHGAKGPMQFLESTWDGYKTASGRSNPHICNIHDSVYAASAMLANNSGVPKESGWKVNTNNWSDYNIKRTAGAYYGACHNCGPDPLKSGYHDCRRLGMNYCDFTATHCNGAPLSNSSRSFTTPTYTSGGWHDYTSEYSGPAENHPDINLIVRGYEKISGLLELFEFAHPGDPNAPCLNTLVAGEPYPSVTNLYQVYQWDWVNNKRGGLIKPSDYFDSNFPSDLATLVGFATTEGDEILVPEAGYGGIGGGYEVLVLYASPTSITLKYTLEDDMICGYGLHLENFNVDPDILSFYNRLNNEGRKQLPALCAGQKIGTGKDGEIRVAIRDTGAFLDPRWKNDWWQCNKTATAVSCETTAMTPLETHDCLEQSSEGVVIIAGESHVCSDFIEKRGSIHKDETPRRIPVSISPGNISLLSVKFPDFTQAASRVALALKRTLAYSYVKDLHLPGATTMYFKHFAVPQKEDSTFDYDNMTECPGGTPESEVDVPGNLWGKLAGGIRGLCTYLGFCEPVEAYQFKLADTGYSCDTGSCAPGQEAKEYKLYPKKNQPYFSLNTYADQTTKTEIETEIINGEEVEVPKYKTKQKKEIKFLSRSQLAGGQETADNADFFYNFLPAGMRKKIEPKDDAKALSEGFRYDVGFSPVDEGEHKAQYYNLRKIRNAYCMHLCTIYPADTDIKSIDEICISCNPDDYDYQPPHPKPEDAHEFCNWDGYGCHYHDNDYCEHLCKGDPICLKTCDMCELCEGCRCLPDSLPPPGKFFCNDYSDPKCGANLCLGKCHWEFFEPNPNGGYGDCYFQNTNVCVRNDWGGSCTKICNAACCQ